MNIFLYIIWNNAYYKKKEIIEDIDNNFNILKIIEIKWSKQLFSENLSRFYGQKLTPNSFKEKACGNGPFTLIVFEDKNPVYELRKTSRGEDEIVNIHTFDKKTLYREWTTGNEKKIHSKIHGTNSTLETEHDLTLLTGFSPEDFTKNIDNIPNRINQDIVGAHGWDSFEQLFYILNHTCEYVVLRNFEEYPENFHIGSHADIDILAKNFTDIKSICKANLVYKQDYRVQCMVKISNEPTQFDFRFVGDGYYDDDWEKKILSTRVLKNGIYIPNNSEYKYMILYHALIHKLTIAEDYKTRLNKMFGNKNWNENLLSSFLFDNGYKYVEPADLSVYFNNSIANIKISKKRMLKMFYIKIKKLIKKICKGHRK